VAVSASGGRLDVLDLPPRLVGGREYRIRLKAVVTTNASRRRELNAAL